MTTPNLAKELLKPEVGSPEPKCDDILAPKPRGLSYDLDPARLFVMMTHEGRTTLLDRSCSDQPCSKGFQVLPDLTVRLCQDTCSALRTGHDKVLEVAYGCHD